MNTQEKETPKLVVPGPLIIFYKDGTYLFRIGKDVAYYFLKTPRGIIFPLIHILFFLIGWATWFQIGLFVVCSIVCNNITIYLLYVVLSTLMSLIYIYKSKVIQLSSQGRKKAEILYERYYVLNPVFHKSPRGESMVEIFKILNITMVFALMGANLINLHPTFKNSIRW